MTVLFHHDSNAGNDGNGGEDARDRHVLLMMASTLCRAPGLLMG